jgi:hypothetical protein
MINEEINSVYEIAAIPEFELKVYNNGDIKKGGKLIIVGVIIFQCWEIIGSMLIVVCQNHSYIYSLLQNKLVVAKKFEKNIYMKKIIGMIGLLVAGVDYRGCPIFIYGQNICACSHGSSDIIHIQKITYENEQYFGHFFTVYKNSIRETKYVCNINGPTIETTEIDDTEFRILRPRMSLLDYCKLCTQSTKL